MAEIDEERLQTLMELVLKENPEMDQCGMGSMCKSIIK